MNQRRFRGLLCLLLMTFFSLSGLGASQQTQVRVKAETASIRLKPDVESQVLGSAPRGAVFDVQDQTGEWYLVRYTPDNSRYELAGYIHMSDVEPVSPPTPAPKTMAPAPVQPQHTRPQPQAAAPQARPAGNIPQDLASMQKTEKSMRRLSLAFLSLIKQMDPVETSGFAARSSDMVRVVIDGCQVYEAMDPQSQVIDTPRINDEFDVLGKNDGFYQIRLLDGREGWISEQCIQVFSRQSRQSVIHFRGISPKDIKNYLETATDIFASITQQKQFADQIYKKNSAQALGQDPSFQASYLKIQKYFGYAGEFYGRFMEDKSFQTPGASILDRLSAWAELLLGRNAYGTEYLLENPVDRSGFVHDLSVGADLRTFGAAIT